jgi:hypothetical protein
LINIAGGERRRFIGAVSVGHKVVFAPCLDFWVGVLDTSTNVFSSVAIDGVKSLGCPSWTGAAAVGDKVYSGPYYYSLRAYTSVNIGVFDTSTDTFSLIAIDSQASRFATAASLGNKIYFTPRWDTNIGVLDTSTNAFSLIRTGTDVGTVSGAVAVGTNMYFTPYEKPYVGVLDTTDNTYTVISVPLSDHFLFLGSTAVGHIIYFAPYGATKIGVLDTCTRTFTLIETPGVTATSQKFFGAASIGNKVYFAPWNAANVGVLDTSTGAFSLIAIEGVTATSERFSGAAVVNNKVYFTPSNEFKIGVLDPGRHTVHIHARTHMQIHIHIHTNAHTYAHTTSGMSNVEPVPSAVCGTPTSHTCSTHSQMTHKHMCTSFDTHV